MQVEPLLEVLVGKCLEQGLMEVMEEEELAAMRAHQQHYEQVSFWVNACCDHAAPLLSMRHHAECLPTCSDPLGVGTLCCLAAHMLT